MSDPVNVAGVYNALVQRRLQPDFNAKAPNPVEQATEVMQRIQEVSRPVTLEGLEEFLHKHEVNAIPEALLLEHAQRRFRINPNALRHMMEELGWRRQKVKWGGVDYTRVIYARPKFVIQNGQIVSPDGSREGIAEHVGLVEDRIQSARKPEADGNANQRTQNQAGRGQLQDIDKHGENLLWYLLVDTSRSAV